MNNFFGGHPVCNGGRLRTGRSDGGGRAQTGVPSTTAEARTSASWETRRTPGRWEDLQRGNKRYLTTIRWGWLGSRVVSVIWLRRRRAGVQIAAATLSGNSLRQTVHTRRASVHQAAKLVAAILRVARATAGLAESNGSLPLGLWLMSPAGWLPRAEISSGTLRSAIEKYMAAAEF